MTIFIFIIWAVYYIYQQHFADGRYVYFADGRYKYVKDDVSIGTGTFGVVRKCIRCEDKKMFAFKSIKDDDSNSLKDFTGECQKLEELDHKNTRYL